MNFPRSAAIALALIAGTGAAVADPSGHSAKMKDGLPDILGSAFAFDDLPGWRGDDHRAAFAVFRASCQTLIESKPALRPGRPAFPALLARCAQALDLPADISPEQARTFFEAAFRPVRIGADGFMTAYYEPIFEGALTPSAEYPIPILARPSDLVTLTPSETAPALPPGLAAARRTDDGLVEHPDRAAIWSGALAGRGLELAYLRDRVDLFMAQVQGSLRVRLADGRLLRFAYAGRTGHAYTSIGRILVDEDHIEKSSMSLERLTGWLRAHPDIGRRIMERNRSYIFFAERPDLPAKLGPIGAAGLPLTPGRSIAIDRTLWAYGLPFWLQGTLPTPGGGDVALRRLMIAQDTGSAIVGPARIDYFMGTGDDAGTRAGLVRHPVSVTVLWPWPEPARGTDNR